MAGSRHSPAQDGPFKHWGVLTYLTASVQTLISPGTKSIMTAPVPTLPTIPGLSDRCLVGGILPLPKDDQLPPRSLTGFDHPSTRGHILLYKCSSTPLDGPCMGPLVPLHGWLVYYMCSHHPLSVPDRCVAGMQILKAALRPFRL